MRWLADFVYLGVGLLYLPVAIYNALVLGKNRRGWRDRFGWVPRFDPSRERIWVHAVSLGEINATPKLVEELRKRRPDCEIVFSTTTDTGYARAVQLYGAEQVFRFPLDFSLVVSRVLSRVQPAMIVLVELELWYNLIRQATRQGIPVVVVNGRLTERSAARLAKLGGIAKSMFESLAWVGAQDEKIAARFVSLGAVSDRVQVTSSLKWDTANVSDSVEGADELAREIGLDRSRPLWVCGSTGPGEETLILEAYKKLGDGAPSLAIVPRKPERFDDVAELIERFEFRCIRRSRCNESTTHVSDENRAVVLGDTMGELRKFYALADVVFVGRTLVPMGGSDPMEVAALGKAMIVGPHTDNFQMPIDALQRADAIRVIESAHALPASVRKLLDDSSLRDSMAKRASAVVLDNQGATARTADRLIDMLER